MNSDSLPQIKDANMQTNASDSPVTDPQNVQIPISPPQIAEANPNLQPTTAPPIPPFQTPQAPPNQNQPIAKKPFFSRKIIIIILIIIFLLIAGTGIFLAVKNIPALNSLIPGQAAKSQFLPPGLNLKATKLYSGDFGTREEEIVVSPNGKHFAFPKLNSQHKGLSVIYDGTEGKAYETVGKITFSPDSNHYFYLANNIRSQGPKRFLVVDGVEKYSYETEITDPVFSQDGKHIAFGAGRIEDKKTKRFVVLDGKELTSYDNALSIKPAFSPDGTQIASEVRNVGNSFVVMNDKEGKHYNFVGSTTFSPDGKRVAYGASDSKGAYLVVNEKEEVTIPKDESGRGEPKPIFSPDGKKLAYIYDDKKDNYYVFLDNKKSQYKILFNSNLVWAPDSIHYAYQSSTDFNREKPEEYFTFIVNTDKEGEKYFKEFTDPSFSLDSKHLVYGAKSKDGKWYIVLDGKILEGEYKKLWKPIFSSDGKSIVFPARVDNDLLWVVGSSDTKTQNVPTEVVIPKSTPKPSAAPAAADITKDYSACFAKYDNRFMPDVIGRYKKTETLIDKSYPYEDIGDSGDKLKVNWGTKALYKRTQVPAGANETLRITILEFTDLSTFNSDKEEAKAQEKINGLEVLETMIGNDGSTVHIFSHVSGTKTYIHFQFSEKEYDTRDTFGIWLKQVCPGV